MVCAPYDYTDCGYDLVFQPMGILKGQYDGGYEIYFNPWHPNYLEEDCFGFTVWKHEWLHVRIGAFHLNSMNTYYDIQCLLRDGYSMKYVMSSSEW